jgi:ABC-type multidrug transport system ATPase subunit
MPMIEITDLTKTFGRLRAVDGVTFRVRGGEAVALWGPNGAGKTTVIRCLLGLLRYRGRIAVAGMDARRAGKACRSAIGYVPQELAFHQDFRVDEGLSFFARLRRCGRDRPDAVLRQVALGDHARKRIGELSGGLKQRLALAIALLPDPPILVLDELTASLDRAAREGFLAALSELAAAGKTILFTSHRSDEVQRLATRVVVMEAGRIRLECRPEELPARLDLRCVLRVVVPKQQLDAAASLLRRMDVPVSRNGHGLFVEVPAADKAQPIRALLESRIDVCDFELSGGRLEPDTGDPRP